MSDISVHTIREWAHEGGEIARHYFNAVKGNVKADNSIVTQADIEIEQMLRKRIKEHYPEHGIMGEEEGTHGIDREYIWCLDPLDGTEAFFLGLPVWGVSIGLLRHKQPYLGVVYLPATDECYWNDAQGAYWNDERIHVSQQTKLSRKNWFFIPSSAHLEYHMTLSGKVRSFGSFAAHLCYVARGIGTAALIGYWPHAWDIAAGMAILHAAGGVTVTLPDGEPLELSMLFDGNRSRKPILSAPPALVGELAKAIRAKDVSEQ